MVTKLAKDQVRAMAEVGSPVVALICSFSVPFAGVYCCGQGGLGEGWSWMGVGWMGLGWDGVA